MLKMLKKDIELNFRVFNETPQVERNANIVVFCSARTGVFQKLLRKLDESNVCLNVFVFGEKEKVLLEERYENLKITVIETYGKFSLKKVKEYESQLGNIPINKVVFLGGVVHSEGLLNVYDVVCEMFDEGIDIYKFIGDNGWVYYPHLAEYVKLFKLYLYVLNKFSNILNGVDE